MKLLLSAIRFYQALSRMLIQQGVFVPVSGCRQWPTCSDYAIHVIRARGPVRGTLLAMKRLSRCHPWASLPNHVH